jgi:hypothetical protein
MGAKGIRVISERVMRSHPGQAAGSVRKKKNKARRIEELHAEAKKDGVDVATVKKRRQQEINNLPSDAWMRAHVRSSPPPARRLGWY